MKTKFMLAILGVVLLMSCNQKAKDVEVTDQKELSTAQQQEYLVLGDSISARAQQVLLSNVAEQMKLGGPVGALDFCNEKAMFLTDSVSDEFSKKIQRLTDKTRNPDNAIVNDIDQKAWEDIKGLMADANAGKHLILSDESDVYYYKAIPIGMPTCLMCHGSKETDIAPATLEAIAKKYPNDQATGYTMGELRGMWKIKMN